MQYTIKSGVLYQEPSHHPLAKMKRALAGPTQKIYPCEGELILKTEIRYPDTEKAHTGDVRNKEYVLTDGGGNVVASARPGYAQGDDPDVVGWPLCRLPRVDHAKVSMDGTENTLTMHSSQRYTVRNADGVEILRITHRGMEGGWAIEDEYPFPPEIICGMFAFCRYIEQENEFLNV